MAPHGQEHRRRIPGRILGRIISGSAVVCAAVAGILVIAQVSSNPAPTMRKCLRITSALRPWSTDPSPISTLLIISW